MDEGRVSQAESKTRATVVRNDERRRNESELSVNPQDSFYLSLIFRDKREVFRAEVITKSILSKNQ